MMLRITLYRAYAIRRAIADLARGNRREIQFRHIASENCWLRCEQKKSMRERFFLGAQFCGDAGFFRIEMTTKLIDDLVFLCSIIRYSNKLLMYLVLAFLQLRNINL